LDKVVWDSIIYNTNAFHLLVKLDTEKMRTICKPFAKELAEVVFHPARLMRICEKYNMDLDEYFELV
jgi:hypothetical protein